MPKPLRIAIWHNLPSGGGKRQLYMHVQGLLQRGHFVESWCPDSADQEYLPLGNLVKEHVIPLPQESASFHSPVRPIGATRRLLSSLEDHCRTCADAINKGDFDVLFAGACLFLRTTPIAGMVNLPSAIYLGEPYRWFYEAMPELPWMAPGTVEEPLTLSPRQWRARAAKASELNSIRVQARAELEYLRSFDLVLANSVFSRETILRTYNIESRVCLLGVDAGYYRPTGEPKERFVVGLGTIYHAKGVDRAIRAVGAVTAASRPTLVWIGNGAADDELEGYKRLARKLHVDFVPRIHIPDADVISLLSRAAAMIYTSRLEPFGLAPLEANACGTAVVGIAEGGVRESIVDGVNGFLAPDDDPQRIGALLERFTDDPQLASRMGGLAREHVLRHWSLEGCTDRIETALANLAAAGQAGARLPDGQELRDLKPTNNVRLSIEARTIRDRTIEIRGWAFVDDGRDAAGSETYVLIRNATGSQLLRTRRTTRTDVTRHFGGIRDYDESGFCAKGVIELEAPYDIGILIVRTADKALHII